MLQQQQQQQVVDRLCDAAARAAKADFLLYGGTAVLGSVLLKFGLPRAAVCRATQLIKVQSQNGNTKPAGAAISCSQL
jgi:hypothetical protein